MTARRLVDVAVSAAALAVLAPILGVAALAVRATSAGPVLFRQPRVGRGGRPFVLLKLRTMRHGVGGPRLTGAGDARVTPIGAWLRRWKVDELPQLVNVLRGDMSLIGPRPEVPEYLAAVGEAGRAYASVQPGLADPATLAFYDEAALLAEAADPGDPERHYVAVILPEKVRLSVAYARERGLGSDLRLLWTIALRIAGIRPARPAWTDSHVAARR
jgi:lipopolysaccharide/colanic/teichoic acid biosynthesis glycosyltransferase